MEIYIYLIFTLLLAIAIWIAYVQRNKYLKVRKLHEQLIDDVDSEREIARNIIVDITNELIRTYARMVTIDQGGSFETDDEVSVIFNRLKEEISRTKEILKYYSETLNIQYIDDENEIEEKA